MQKLILFVATIVAVAVISCSSLVSASIGFENCTRHFIKYDGHSYLPGQQEEGVEVCRDGYIGISYDPYMINPAWSAYYITPEDVADNIPGRKSFYEDPDLEDMKVTQAAVDAEIWGTEWNRGHLAPSRIVSYSEAGKKSTYTCANIAPQEGYFNQHPWMYLETDVFNYIGENYALYIVTGVAYKDRDHAVRDPKSKDQAYPDYYWKVICDPLRNQSAGFYGYQNPPSSLTLNNKHKDYYQARRRESQSNNNLRLSSFTTVEEIEKLYGMRIFPRDVCRTGDVDQDFWGWSTSSYERGAKVPFSAYGTDPSRETLRKLYHEHREDYRRERAAAAAKK